MAKKTPNIFSYKNNRTGQEVWGIDKWLKTPTGPKRSREFGIPTKEQAIARLGAISAEAYQGRAFKMEKACTLTVRAAWEDYRAVSEHDNDSAACDRSRAAHILRHLGSKMAAKLTRADVDAYRCARFKEPSNRRAKDDPSKHTFPLPATLDREVELLKRFLNYAVSCKKLTSNPLAGVGLLRVPNARKVVVPDATFENCLAKLGKRSKWMVEPLTCSYDTGMRIGEVLHLKWEQVDLGTGRVTLYAEETKTEAARVVYLSDRCRKALAALPRHAVAPWVFFNPKTSRPRTLPRRGFKKAFPAGVNVHDLRRSFATIARKRGVPESVVMKLGGWKTTAVFRRYNIVDETDLQAALKVMEAGRFGQVSCQSSVRAEPANENPEEILRARRDLNAEPLGSKFP